MAKPHDSLFKLVFEHPAHAAGELRHMLPATIARHVDWTSLRRLPDSYRDPLLEQHEADLLYGVEIGGRPALLYLLFEHKSAADPWTPLQLLRYAVRILDRYRQQNKATKKLPPLLALVVHHSETGWTCGTQLLDLFDLDGPAGEELALYVPNLRLMVDDLSRHSSKELLARAVPAAVRLALVCLQRLRHADDFRRELREIREAFLAVLAAQDLGEVMSGVLSYLAEVRDELSPKALADVILEEIGPEMERPVTSAYEQLLNRGRAQGEANILLKLLTKRFGAVPDATRDRLRLASPEELEQWALRVLDAQTLGQVFTQE